MELGRSHVDVVPSAAGEPIASATSWLCRGDFDRERMLDMEERVRPVRQRAFGILAVALIGCGPWLGWWPALFLIPAAAYFGIAWFAFATTRKPAASVVEAVQSAH